MKIRITTVVAAFLLWAPFVHAQEKTTIRFGHFPNITHAQGVIAHALSRQGKGWFEKSLGPNIEIQWFTYNAGPSAMEAIFAKSLDLTYVGPGPALNAYLKSNVEFDENASLLVVTEDFGTDGSHVEVRARKRSSRRDVEGSYL